jgi:hypothetical protein
MPEGIFFFFKFTFVQNSVLLFSKLLVFGFLLDSASFNVPLLDVIQLLMLFAGTLMYLTPKLFFLINFYTGSFFLLNIN